MQIRKIAGLGLLLFFMSIGLQGFAQHLPDVESLLENNGLESTEDGYEDIAKYGVCFYKKRCKFQKGQG